MINVIDIRHDGTQGVVVIESRQEPWSQAIMELQNGATRNEAIRAAAAKGLPDPRCGILPTPYAVDGQGELVVDQHQQAIAGYRIDIPVTRKLV